MPLTVMFGYAPVFSVPPVRLLPVRVTSTLLPRTTVAGEIPVRTGGGGGTTVNVTGLVIPPGVVRARLLAPSGVLAAMASVDVAVVGLPTVTAPKVMFV
jgi:hypothetical protein